MKSTLVLNASYEPLGVIPVHRAVNLILASKAASVDDSSDIIHAANMSMSLPYVIRMNYFIRKTHYSSRMPFSRHGVLVRDNYRCAYCGKRSVENMTIDHIVPRSKGGEHSWENCVASCLKFNGHKKDHSLAQSGLTLRVKPAAPNMYSSILLKAVGAPSMFESWSSYIFMYSPDLKDHFVKQGFVDDKIAHLFTN